MLNQKELNQKINNWKDIYLNMKNINLQKGSKAWNEITNTFGNIVDTRDLFETNEYIELAKEQFEYFKSVIFENGDTRKTYVDAHKNDWPDVVEQLNYLSKNSAIRSIFNI